MTSFADLGHPVRDRADASGEFTRCAARVVMQTLELERIADRSGLTVPTPALTNLRDARRVIDALIRRAPAAEPDLDGELKPKVRLADPPEVNPRLRVSVETLPHQRKGETR